MTDARGGGRLRGARSLPRALPPLRERGDGRRCDRSRPPDDGQKAGLAAGHRLRGDDRSPPPGWSPATASVQRACSCDCRSPTATASCSPATKWHVPFAAAADRLLVLARTGDGPEDDRPLPRRPDAAGRDARAADDLDLDRHPVRGRRFEGVTASAGDRVGGPGRGGRRGHEVMHDGAILLAAQAIGGAAHALEITTQYAKDREQFDKPLGAFQALAHYLADAKTTVDGGTHARPRGGVGTLRGSRRRPGSRRWRSSSPARPSATSPPWRSRSSAASASPSSTTIQLYFRRAKQLQISWWDSRTCEDLVAASVLDTPLLTI